MLYFAILIFQHIVLWKDLLFLFLLKHVNITPDRV
jgi:hypothetical protein